jgi:16S rRNA processing protein RimM
MDALHYFGKVVKTHGIEGELHILCEPDLSEIVIKEEVLFLEYEGIALPFYINSIKMLNSGAFLISFLDYDKIGLVKRFVSCKVFINPKDKSTIPEVFDERALISYTFIDINLGELGVLEDVIFKQQNLFVLNRDGNEILLPVISEFISEINHSAKEVYLELPEGIIDEF